MALSGGRHALQPRKAYFVEFYSGAKGFWLLAFYEISRTPLLSYSHFQGVKLKLNIRAFFRGIVCFSTIIDSFQILNLNIFRIWLLHPVHTPKHCIFTIFYHKVVHTTFFVVCSVIRLWIIFFGNLGYFRQAILVFV